MSSDNYTPIMGFPPGGYLKEELAARGITLETFSACTGMPLEKLQALIDNKRSLLLSDAEKIARFLGMDPLSWINLAQAYERWWEKYGKHGKGL